MSRLNGLRRKVDEIEGRLQRLGALGALGKEDRIDLKEEIAEIEDRLEIFSQWVYSRLAAVEKAALRATGSDG